MCDLDRLIGLIEDPNPITSYSAIGAIGRYLNFRGSGERRPLRSEAEVEEAVASLRASPPVTLARVCTMLRTMAVPCWGRVTRDGLNTPPPRLGGAALTALEGIDASLALLQCAMSILNDSDEINRGAAAVTVIGRTGVEDGRTACTHLPPPS